MNPETNDASRFTGFEIAVESCFSILQGDYPTLPFVTRRRRCGQMSGARPGTDPRFTFHASRFDKLTVPSQVEGRFTVLGSGPSTMQMVADRSSQ
jgi:hypothetical protein